MSENESVQQETNQKQLEKKQFLSESAIVGSPEWGEPLKRIIGAIAFVACAFLVFQFSAILPLVFTSMVLAYLFHPVADFFQHRLLGGKLRGLAVILTFLLVVSIIVISLLFVIPTLIEQIQSFIASLPGYLQSIQDWVLVNLTEEISFVGTPLERIAPEPFTIASTLGIDTGEDGVLEVFDVLQSQVENINTVAIAQRLASSVTDITGSAFTFLGGAVSTGLNILFLITMTLYLMNDGENMVAAVSKAVPDGYHDDFRHMMRELGFVWNAYLRGEAILSLIMGIGMYLVATILGIPNAIFLGIFAGLMEFIPNLGPAMAMIPAALIALFSTSTTLPLSGWVFALVVIVVWTILQQTEAALLIPRIVGDSLNLHPFVVMVAVLAGISVGGIFAVLIAAPVVASLRLIGQYVYGKLTGRPPFPVSRHLADQMRRERRPLLVRFGDYCANMVRNLISSRMVTKRK